MRGEVNFFTTIQAYFVRCPKQKSKTTSFYIQMYPKLVGNMTSETTFGYWKVVFSLGKKEKKGHNFLGPNGRIFKFAYSESSHQIWPLGYNRILFFFYLGEIGFRPHAGRSFYNIMSNLHTFLIKKAKIWRNTPNFITTRPLFQEFSGGNRSSINSPYIGFYMYSRRFLVH